MKKLRVGVILLFLISAGLYGYNSYVTEKQEDRMSPVISAETEEIKVSVNAGEEALLQGITAADDRDGDVTENVVIASYSSMIDFGVRKITYAAFDSSNNAATYTRRLVYTDYRSPEFVITGPFEFRSSESSPDFLENITAEDVLDGDLTRQIRFSTDNYVMDSENNYTVNVSLQVTNSAGDTAVLEPEVRVVGSEEYNSPCPAMSQYVFYTKAGSRITFSRYLTGVRRGDSVSTFEELGLEQPYTLEVDDSEVRYYVPGVYPVTLTFDILEETEIPGQTGTADVLTGQMSKHETVVYVVVREQ